MGICSLLLDNAYFRNIKLSADIDVSTLPTLYSFPTNKSIFQAYAKTLQTAATTATYRATKYGFPAIEFREGAFQFLDVDCSDSSSTVKFSEAGAVFTTVADGASIAIASTATPVIYTDITITKNRMYLSSNDYNASSYKDGSLMQTVALQNKYQ